MERWTWKALCNEVLFRFGKNLASSEIWTRDPSEPKSGALTARPHGRFYIVNAKYHKPSVKALVQADFPVYAQAESLFKSK